MHTIITGAGGFVGRHLATRLAASLNPGDRLTLIDVSFGAFRTPLNAHVITGKISDSAVLRGTFQSGVDTVFHLATLPGRGAEEDFVAGREANLDGTVALLEALRLSAHRARVIFTSSASVYGMPIPSRVDDATLPQPALSYAAHKYVGEILVNDYSRRGYIEGLSLRLSGILARPPGSTVNASAFLNDLFYAARAGKPFTVPMAPDKASWLMSVRCCVDNLLHASRLPADTLPERRNWLLPALTVTMRELVDGLARVYGAQVKEHISFSSVPAIERMFAQPPMIATMAEQLGFRHDGSIDELIQRAIRPEADS